MNIKLEALRGGGVQTFEVAVESDPPDVIFWDNRVFRYQRTDGVWDQKKHVYRESTASRLSDDGAKLEPPAIGDFAPTALEAPAPAAEDPDFDHELRKLSLALTPAQADQLKRMRERGGYANNKAVLLAGLELLERGGAISNEALITMLSKRLRGLDHAGGASSKVVGLKQ